MKQSPLDHKYRLVASNPNYSDFCDLLEEEIKSIVDVRTKINIIMGEDSLGARQAIAFELTNIIDKIKKTRKNELRNEPEELDNENL